VHYTNTQLCEARMTDMKNFCLTEQPIKIS